MDLNGKIAVVTGAAMGIGKAITEILLQNGAKVALLDVNETAAESLMEALNKQYGQERTLFLKCNVESEEQIKAAFQKTTETFGGMDILCNNAGIMNESAWEQAVSINLMGVIRGTYQALEYMSKLNGGRGGVIINTASMAGISPLLSCPVYTATKNGVVGFTRAMAAASTASGYGIRVNALCPSFVQTELLSTITSKMGRFSHLVDKTEQLVEKLGMLSVSEVAECFLELVTDETKNGEALLVIPKVKKYATFPSV
ncbi:15-hydroxyprostaglandin dehydrogenase [NAD(+)]-like [Seriola lalandi dorsalis]|uniref:15-hydroxyprostaglandin dehydrogenase [NAD(+)] n=1 Tax=Seriola lalandi dorsalis TaxID=1841481 RepID=A0A3B4XRT7_SERLL|nr:15-hydroxyprostaglandin dehydrogenase [NAD(+)]-like [Seriola lalandi dorsalis]XP_056254295.1 15-hydroxyprostaglandin dehydrogenase [NAD(+)] [Seriola aureovittata]